MVNKVELDEILLAKRSKIMSKLYKYCLKEYTRDEIIKLQMIRWAENINRQIMLEEWEFLWGRIWKISECSRLKENSIKMFYRWYITPDIIAKTSEGKYTDRCWKCEQEHGTFFHMWWTCPIAKKFWEMIYYEIVKIYKIQFEKATELWLLGLKMEDFDRKDRVSVWNLITVARLQYASLWKQKKIPTVESGILSWLDIIEMDKYTKKLRLQSQVDFQECWEKVKLYVERSWGIKRYLNVFEWNIQCLVVRA